MPNFFQRRECLVPTWRGWLAIFVVAALLGVGFVRGVYWWLAVEEPVAGGVLVVEGWVPDRALRVAMKEFREHSYSGLYVTGIPMEHGTVFSEYKTYAELGAASILAMGGDPAAVHAVPAPSVPRDRTYTTALVLRDWLRAHHVPADRVSLISVGAHARRSRLLYEMAFGPGTRVGIMAVPAGDFRPESWWTSSEGFRTVTDEIIAYCYARFLFRPEPIPPAP